MPAGGDVAERCNPKFGHKIDFVDEMKEWFSNNSPRKSILVGDLNIAPLAEDGGQRGSCGMLSAILILNVKN